MTLDCPAALARSPPMRERQRAREAGERAVWEELAKEAEAEKAILPSRLGATVINRSRLEGTFAFAEGYLDASTAAGLKAIQAAAEQTPKSEMLELIASGETAAAKLDLDEAETRALIDQQLKDSLWEADTTSLRHANGARPAQGRNRAIAEWPTASGPADYALFAGLTLVGLVEAKRRRKNVSGAIDQAERYSSGIGASDDFAFAGGPWAITKSPLSLPPTGGPT